MGQGDEGVVSGGVGRSGAGDDVSAQRGFALVMALVLLMLVSVWTVALLHLAGSEAILAANLADNSQARACAEAGLELALAQLQNPSGSPWGAHSLEVDGVVVCTFLTAPAWVSATEVSVMSTASTARPRPATGVARRSLIYDAAASRWVVKPGTYRES
jgi:Tfp pilus assembly protein PilX